jgi:hypothetical protein
MNAVMPIILQNWTNFKLIFAQNLLDIFSIFENLFKKCSFDHTIFLNLFRNLVFQKIKMVKVFDIEKHNWVQILLLVIFKDLRKLRR